MDTVGNGSRPGTDAPTSDSPPLPAEQLSHFSPFHYIVVTQSPISAIANAFTFYILLREKSSFDDVTKLFLKALTVAYALCGVAPAFYSLAQLITGNDKQFSICLYNGIVFYPGLYLSLDMSLLITLNRYFMVVKPLKYYNVVTGRRAVIFVSLAVAHVVVITMIYVPFRGSAVREFLSYICTFQFRKVAGNFYSMTPLLHFLVVAVVTSFCNVHLLVISRRHSIQISRLTNDFMAMRDTGIASQHLRHTTDDVTATSVDANESTGESSTNKDLRSDRRNKRAILTILLLNIVVFVAWIPLVIYYVFEFVGVPFSLGWRTFVFALVISASWWHCLIYVVTNRTFRQTAKRTVLSIWVKLRCSNRTEVQPVWLSDV